MVSELFVEPQTPPKSIGTGRAVDLSSRSDVEISDRGNNEQRSIDHPPPFGLRQEGLPPRRHSD
jgi:hypothetical protein